MSRRRLIPIALVVTALLAVVAIAASGHPLGSSGGGSSGGVPTSFWDYAYTTFLIFVGLWFIMGVAAAGLHRRGPGRERQRVRGRYATLLAILIIVSAVRIFVAGHLHLNRLFHHHPPPVRVHTGRGTKGKNGPPLQRTSQPVHFRWDELAIVLGLVLGIGLLAATARSRLGAPAKSRPAPEVLAAALDESLDDLRNDPDLRRAIIAAYARMEHALAAAGIARHPAEAPLEYVERALLNLDASASAVRRLTDLFEWARFSHHEPDPPMRDEAIDALVAVRDELRAGVPDMAPA